MLVSFVPVRKLVVFCHVVENTPVRVREGLECFMIDGKGIQTRRETVSVGNGPHWRYTHRGESRRLPAASRPLARHLLGNTHARAGWSRLRRHGQTCSGPRSGPQICAFVEDEPCLRGKWSHLD